MCRFVIYEGPPIAIADLVTRPAHSIIHQSYKAEEREEPLNGDGFGVAWYAPDICHEPAVFRDVTPAWNNENLIHLARVTRSGTILAHVRAATQGLAVTHTNCHPFTSGRYAFMHNGNLANFARIRRRLLSSLSDRAFAAIRGTTDSEHMFAVFLDRLAEQDHESPLERLSGALQATLRQIAELASGNDEASTLNLAATDGEHIVVSRCLLGSGLPANTLYVRQGDQLRCEDGVCYMDTSGDERGAVMIASEPLFDHPAWQLVETNHLVLVDRDRSLEIRPLSLG